MHHMIGSVTNLHLLRLRTLEFHGNFREDSEGSVVSMLRFSCDIVKVPMKHGKFQDICFHFDMWSWRSFAVWDSILVVLEEAAILEEILIVAAGKPTVTIEIPLLQHVHDATPMFDIARSVFPRTYHAERLVMSPDRE